MKDEIKKRYNKRFLLLLLIVFFLCPRPSIAQPINYNFNFTGDLGIWDITGTYTDDSIGGNISYTVTQDSSGKLTGFGTANVTALGVYIEMTYDIKGSVKQRNGVATVKLCLNFSGTATYLGDIYRFRAKEQVTAEIDTNVAVMRGIVKVSVAIQGLGSDSATINFEADIPDVNMDGSFEIDFEVASDGRNLIGDGTVTLSNGDPYNFTVKGKINERKNESAFSLNATDNNTKGCKLKIKVNEGTDQIISLNGKILGQSIRQ